jgi:hypothetical protein
MINKFLVLSLLVVAAAAGGKQHHGGKGKRGGCACKKATTYKECEPLIAEDKCIFIKGKHFAHCAPKRHRGKGKEHYGGKGHGVQDWCYSQAGSDEAKCKPLVEQQKCQWFLYQEEGKEGKEGKCILKREKGKQHGDKKHQFGGKGHGVQDWCYSQAGSDESKCKPLVEQQKCQWFLYQEEGKEGKEGKCILAETVVDKEASMSMSADDEIYFDTQMSKNTPPPPPPPQRHHGPPPPPCDDDSRPTCSDGSPPHHGPQACSDGSPPKCADGTVARPPPRRHHGHCKFMMVLMGVAIYCLGLFTSCLKQRCCPNRCNCCKKRPVNASSVVVPAVVNVATIADPALAKKQPMTPIVIQEE